MTIWQQVMDMVFGQSKKTSLLGAVILGLSWYDSLGLAIPTSWADAKKIWFPAILAAALRLAKDGDVSHSNNPQSAPQKVG